MSFMQAGFYCFSYCDISKELIILQEDRIKMQKNWKFFAHGMAVAVILPMTVYSADNDGRD